MAVLHEGKHTGEFLVSEGNGAISREVVTIAEGQDLGVGAVLGQLTSGGKYTALATTGTDGNEVAAAVLFDDVDATDGDKPGVVVARLAEVRASDLVWPSGITAGAKESAVAALAAKHIIVR